MFESHVKIADIFYLSDTNRYTKVVFEKSFFWGEVEINSFLGGGETKSGEVG